MAKYYGEIGYAEMYEFKEGDWRERIVPYSHSGDLIRDTRQLQTTNQVNDNIKVSNVISIIANPYATEHFFNIRYAVLHGAKWKVTNVDVAYPRLILTLGGLYNE